MKKTLITLLLAMAFTITCAADVYAADKIPAHAHISVVTTEGTFKLELDGKAAPLTVANFLALVDSGFYDGTIFHRIIPGFMIQGGGYTPGNQSKESDDTIPNESGNGLGSFRGTIAMARTGDPHSAGSQFFINVVDNVEADSDTANLDPVKDSVKGRWGYAVFGSVIEGMDVIDKIAAAKTLPNGPGGAPAPIVPIVIETMSRVTYD
jgi:cyclophilin family peptidyl-prolyl cis-trans isomerase